MKTRAVPFHFAELRAKGGSRFDVADHSGEDFIESCRRASETARATVGTDSGEIRAESWTGSFRGEEAPLEGDLIVGAGCGLVGSYHKTGGAHNTERHPVHATMGRREREASKSRSR